MDLYADREVADVDVELYTAGALIRGTMRTRLRRITDILNLGGVTQLLLHQARVDPLADATGSETFNAPELRVRLAEVLLALGGEPGERPPEVQIVRKPMPVTLGVGPFLLDGQLYVAPDTSPADAFFNPMDPFAPITDAHFRRLGEPTSARHEAVVAVNRERVELFAASEERMPGDEPERYPEAADPRAWFRDR
jgi:hypothetical protein